MQFNLKSIAIFSALAGILVMPASIASPVMAEVSMDSSDFANPSNGESEGAGVSLAENGDDEGVNVAPNEGETACEDSNASANRC